MLRTITAKRNGLWAKVPIVPFEGQEAYKPSDKDMLRAKIEEHVAKREVLHYENGTPILKSKETPSLEETVDNIMNDIKLAYE